jgi:hypothetical protein
MNLIIHVHREVLGSGETAWILRELATRLDGHPHFSPGHYQDLFDQNGKPVGYATVLDDSGLKGWTLLSAEVLAPAMLRRIVEENGLLPSVKWVREQTNLGLIESKRLVDAFILKNNLKPARPAPRYRLEPHS